MFAGLGKFSQCDANRGTTKYCTNWMQISRLKFHPEYDLLSVLPIHISKGDNSGHSISRKSAKAFGSCC